MADKPSVTTELIVVRHGETVWNQIGKQQGQLDTELSELGIAQAATVADSLSNERIDALYTSDLGRAMQTAEIINRRLELDILTDARLRERHHGILQGLTLAEFEQQYPKEHALFRGGDPDYCIPQGESARQRHDRCIACANELATRHHGLRVLIITHGGVLESFFRHTQDLDLKTPRRFTLYNASLNSFEITDGRWILDRWGDTHHLKHLGTRDDW